ncbi:MAG: hypothetical protein QME14_09675 [Methanobacteriaceae archaeon]|nr:hypothetical protein [Methanobacteriaceae archaeon]
MKATTGFDFYETLRYFLPGLLLVFLFGYMVFPEYGRKFSLLEKITFSVLIGFIIHSFGIYKWALGQQKLEKNIMKRRKNF